MAASHVSSRVPNAASTTTTQVEDPQRVAAITDGVLRLRAQSVERRGITWAEDVIDNEDMGKKTSKVCCIYHKPRAVGESSSEDSSDSSSSDSDSEPDNSTARVGGKGKRKAQHSHGDDKACGLDKSASDPKKTVKDKEKQRKGRNAYEKLPKANTTTTQTVT